MRSPSRSRSRRPTSRSERPSPYTSAVSKNVTPASAAACSVAIAASSSTVPQSAPICQAPKPISETTRPSLPMLRGLMRRERIGALARTSDESAPLVRTAAGGPDRDNPVVLEALPLYGRESEIRALERLIDGLDSRGAAVLVRGEAGIGKSALLEAVSRTARARDVLVLQATGVPSEADVPFAGLHQLLHTRVADLGGLPGPQRAALEAAFGMTGAAAPDLFLIALATLHLLGDLADRAPLLLVVEGAQWLDRSTTQALACVGRRLAMDRILLLLAVRDDVESVSEGAGFEEIRLGPLGEAAAVELLAQNAPDLAPGVRERLLRDAAGNPLALLELPTALDGPAGAILPEHLPPSERLQPPLPGRPPGGPPGAPTPLGP